MSTTSNRSDHPGEPVTPTLARRGWRHRLAAWLAPDLVAADSAIACLIADLQDAEQNARRWKQHADSFEQDRERAVEALADRIRERDGAYRERAQLLAWLTALHPDTSVLTASPDVDEDGWQLLYLVAGGWQMSWHIHPRDAALFRHVTLVDVTDPRAQWDGHGTQQKYERIGNHVRLLVLEADADGLLREAIEVRASVPEADSA
ncbi:hypothetical protein [Streptomyces sp. NBRC 110035]|uniref:hypothetical protein n=1 Tax=Streptomyces sp. NBRC 110035 TaxID=1547867 RepID=UPI0006978569|nr:hypothetical protein [Streptomyces sp. NBRC 110035]